MNRPRITPPFRAEHVGSLVRPLNLYETRDFYEQGLCTCDELKEAEDEAVKKAISLFKDVGMKSITDGEFRRGIFFEGVFEKLEGMTRMRQRPIHEWKRYVPHIALMYEAGVPFEDTVYCTGKIRRTQPFYLDQFLSLKSLVPPEDVGRIKMTFCSPSWFHQRHGSDLTYDHRVYKNDDEYFDDVGAAYRAEIMELYFAGCRHIQFDDPTFCFFCSEKMISGMEEDGVDHEALLDTYIRAINVCTRGRPADLTISCHMCRGNLKLDFSKEMYFAEGGYGRIAQKVFNNLDVDAFYLEYDSERAGDFAALRHLPMNKMAVLGLITTKNPKLERREDLKARIYEAVDALCQTPGRTREMALDQLAISPQCGFASAWQGSPVTEEDQQRKFELLVQTAAEIWPDA